jgi:hypothetical protein
MSKAGRISYHFVQGQSLGEVDELGRPLRDNGWDRVGEPRAVQVKVPGRGLKVCYSQTYSRVSPPASCVKVHRRTCLPASSCDHFVQIYDTDNALLDNLETFVSDALGKGEAAIVISTAARLQELDQRLAAVGHDVKRKRSFGDYIPVDAAGMLERFMVDGLPDEKRFHEAVQSLLATARAGGRTVRAFGEMVALLWADGKRAAALRLEELWHPLCEREQFPLFCAYPKRVFAAGNFVGITAVCAAHTRVF